MSSELTRALVLVGGFGTRLRPLTARVPKPLVPVAGVPLMTRLLTRLREQGFTTVILAVQYLADQFHRAYGDGSALGVDLAIVEEPEPLGTAGAVRHALRSRYAGALPAGPTLILNGDELTSLDWRALGQAHRAFGGAGTIAVREVADPSAFGVVVADATGRVSAWQEKPAPGTARANTINSGAYVLEPGVLERIPPGFAMLERDLFPQTLADAVPLYAYAHQAYSQDIGTLPGYLAANAALLEGRLPDQRPAGSMLAPGVWAAPDAVIDPTATLVGPAYIGAKAAIGPGAHIERAVLWEHVTIGAHALVRDAAVASAYSVPPNATCIGVALADDDAVAV